MLFLFRKNLMPFFEGDGKGGTGGTGGEQCGEPKDGDPKDGAGEQNKNQKTFTQEDLNRIAAQEKRQGASSILKALGFESEEKAKEYLEAKRKEDDEKKDDLQKAKDAEAAANTAKAAAEAKAALLEKRFKVVSMGVSADKADDIVTLATAKAVDGKTFEDAVEDLKKAYPELFMGKQEERRGTGSGGNPPRGKNTGDDDSIGKRLAEKRKTSKSQNKKNSYFSTN